MDDKSEAKTWNPARIVMLVLLGIILIAGTLILALNVMTYVQMQNAMNWSPVNDITQEDKDRYASLIMIPEISDQIVAANLRGIRDPQYCIETRSYDSIEELYEDWNDLIDDRGWIEIEDPLPFCQHDAFVPVRVKGRDTGKPEWGKYEILMDGGWFEYKPE